MAEVKEYRGIRSLVYAEVTADTNESFTCGTVKALAPVAEISRTTKTSSATHYYDNVPAIVIDSTGEDTVTVKTSAIPFDVLADITGQTYDTAKGMFVEGERVNKYFAIGYVAKKTDGTEVFVWRLKGKFSIPDSTHTTDNDGTDAAGQELTFTGINTNHRFVGSGGKTAKAVNVDQSVNPQSEAVFFGSVQTPDTISDTCEVGFTLTPADATLVLKQGETVIAPEASGKYLLAAGAYTYTASATGYVTQTDVALTITAEDVTTGTKTVTVTLSPVPSCAVTFTTTPADATIVVKKGTNVILPDGEGKYHLVADSYTYTASATGYVTQTDVALTISASDVTTGTKTVTVTLIAE